MESLLKDVSRMSQKYSTRNPLAIEHSELNAVIALLKKTAGKTSISKDNFQAKARTPNGFGTHTSQKSGVTLTLQYKSVDDVPVAKIIKVSRERADAFIKELNNEIPFASLETKGQTIVIPAKNITEIRIEEEEDVHKVSESQGKKTSDMGS